MSCRFTTNDKKMINKDENKDENNDISQLEKLNETKETKKLIEEYKNENI